MRPSLPREDLDFVLSKTSTFWSQYRDARLFLTGGTGLIGSWLLESVRHANEVLRARIDVSVLTRNRETAIARLPWLLNTPCVRLVVGDIGTFTPPCGRFDLCVHAAGSAADASRPDDGILFESMVNGTRRILAFADAAGSPRLLFTSSGAVYGRQPHNLPTIPETYLTVAREPETEYGRGKRMSEQLLCDHPASPGLTAVIARVFAVIGPGIPLRGPFAAGNFIRDALDGRPVRVSGNGRPVRSYLYMSDLTIWLLRILMSGQPGEAYNVGSEQEITVAELANLIADACGSTSPIDIADRSDIQGPGPRYVPDTTKARLKLGLSEYTPLPEALRKTIAWFKLAHP